ncbi:MAG: hypothetical protein ACRDPC_15885 [Solirubrobacteraceae bacterium]
MAGDQLEQDVTAPLVPKTMGSRAELLDQRRRVVGLGGDRHLLALPDTGASRTTAAVVGDHRELVPEPLGGAREVSGVAARRG